MNESTIKFLKLLFLILLITGSFTFLFAVADWNKELLFFSLVQLMDGGIGYYMLNSKYPYSLKRRKD